MSISNEQLAAFFKKHPISIVCVLLSIALGVTIYIRRTYITDERATVETKSAEVEKLLTNIKYSNQLKEQVDELVEARKAIDSRLVRAGDLAVNLQYFYRLEADTNTKLATLTPGAASTPSKSGFASIPFNVTVQGPYANVMDFLNRLENGAHFGRIMSASCSKGDGDRVSLSMSLELLGVP